MARCGCGGSGSGGCNCVVTGGANIAVTGSGSPESPYVIAFDGELGGETFVQVLDTASINLTITGDGSLLDPYIISGVVPDGVVVPSTEAVQDIIGAAAGDGLVYSDALNTLSVLLSTDADNALVFGTDGGIYGLTDTSDFARLSLDNLFTAQSIFRQGDGDDEAILPLIVRGWGARTGAAEDMFVVEFGLAEGTLQNVFWCNEVGMPRIRHSTGAANSEVTFRIFNRSGTTGHITSWVVQDEDTAEPRAFVTSQGDVWGRNTHQSEWEAITIDSPTVGGRYTAHAPGSGTDYAAPACRLVEGGTVLEFRGQIDITGGVTADGDVIASALPTTDLLYATTVPMIPARDTRVPVAARTGTGVYGEVRITSTGTLVAGMAIAAAAASISLDGIRITLAA